MSGRGALAEMLAMSLAAALCITLSAACFIRYRAEARDNRAMDEGICAMQDAADMLAASKGGMDAVAGLFPGAEPVDGGVEAYFDGNFEPCGYEDADYCISALRPERDGFMGYSRVILSKRGGAVLSVITASWQEGGAEP